MEQREWSDRYQEIAERLIETEPVLSAIRNTKPRIAYLESSKEKKKGKEIFVHADCERVADRNKWAIDYDFVITVYAPNVIGMTDKQLEILIFHELLHVGIGEPDLFGGYKHYIVPHDTEDFRVVIDRYGIDWSRKK